MSYFHRLSDIVSCSLRDLLASASDPVAAGEQIVVEMERGLAGARRSMQTADHSEQRLLTELTEHRNQIARCVAQAKEELAQKREDLARQALLRKRQHEDLVAGLEQQYAAAIVTREQLATTLRAIEARLTEARHWQQALASQGVAVLQNPAGPWSTLPSTATASSTNAPAALTDPALEAELAALRQELGQS